VSERSVGFTHGIDDGIFSVILFESNDGRGSLRENVCAEAIRKFQTSSHGR